MTKKKKQTRRPFLSQETQLALIAERLSGQADRSFVLLCGAVLDRALEKLIRAKFETLSSGADESIDFLLSDRPVPPLGGAAVRVRLARAMGLIDEDIENALGKLFQIRNDFAHLEIPPALDATLVESACGLLPEESKGYVALLANENLRGWSPKESFRLYAAILFSAIISAEEAISKNPEST